MHRCLPLIFAPLALTLALGGCSDDASPFPPPSAACATAFYVQQGAGGDGSSAQAPLGTLQGAADRAKAGDCILVARGDYQPVVLPGGVSLVGAGSERVTINGGASQAAAVRVDGQGATGGALRGFRVAGGSASRGISATDVSKLEVVKVAIEGARGVALFAEQCSGLLLEDVTVGPVTLVPPRDAGPDPDMGSPDMSSPDMSSPDMGSPDMGSPDAQAPAPIDIGFGIGVVIKASGTATLRRVSVRGSKTQGIVAAGTALTIEDTTVEDSGYHGVAIDCGSGNSCNAKSALTDIKVLRSEGAGIWLRGGEAELKRVSVDEVGTHKLGLLAMGLVATDVALTVEASSVTKSASQGVVLSRCSGSVDGLEVTDSGERGVWLQDIKQLSMKNLQVRRASVAGLGMVGAVVEVEDSRVESVALGQQFTEGQIVDVGDAVQVLDASKLTLRATRVEGAKRLGVLVDASAATVEKNVIESDAPALVQQNNSTVTASDNTNAAGAAIQITIDPKNAFDVVVQRLPVGDGPIPIP